MGAQNVPLAKKYLLVVSVYSFFLYIILCGLLLIFKHPISSLFTDQEAIVNYVLAGLPTMCLAFFLHGIGKAFEGAARGLGKQSYGAGILLVSFYIVCMPLISYFVFTKGMGMKGIWMGPVIGGVIEIVSYLILTVFIFDWNKICKEIHEMLIAS